MRDKLNEQDFLDRAMIELARTHKNVDRMSGPVWCEIIAKDVGKLAQALLDERRKMPRVESTAEQFEKIETFDVDLIEKLVPIFADATRHDIDPRPGIRAILSGLASMPCESPKPLELLAMWFNADDPGRDHWHGNAYCAAEKLRARLGPILAAKDTEIARLVQIVDAMQAAMDRYKSDAEDMLRREAGLHVMLKNYALPTNPKAFAAQYEERVADLETRICTALEERDNARAELVDRMAILAPVDAEGKTPGQVNFEAYETHLRASMTPGIDIRQLVMGAYDAGAKAVLRAFGNKPTIRDMSYDDMVRAFGQEGVGHIVELALDKTGRKETAEALQRVRERIDCALSFDARNDAGELDYAIFRSQATRIIDDELAKLNQ